MKERELVFKNLTSSDKRRKDLYISDTVERNGIKTVTRRHSVYVIGERTKISSPKELMKFKEKAEMSADKRHIFIFKSKDTRLKKDSFICDVVGKFYTVVNDELYKISFKHSFEVDFLVVPTID